MGPRGVIQLSAKNERESRNLERVKERVSGGKMRGVTGSKAVREFGERIAVAKKNKFNLGIIQGGQDVEDGGDFLDAVEDGVSREGDVADGGTEEGVTGDGGARNETVKRIVGIKMRVVAAPN